MNEHASVIVGPEDELTPPQIVEALDRYIVGQTRAKRAVAVAVRNRWRRKQLPAALRDEVTPKNIIMMGPTGVGKTEIARRLATLVNAPFIKVEASKYTEVGYHGRDVESMVRDLVKISVNMTEAAELERVLVDARRNASERLLDFLLPTPSLHAEVASGSGSDGPDLHERTRAKLRAKLEAGELDSRDVEIDVQVSAEPIAHVFSSVGGEEMGLELQDAMEAMMPKRSRTRRCSVAEARRFLESQAAESLVDKDKIIATAVARAQNSGIIFIDEIDKIVGSVTGDEGGGPEVSRSGVQRDLLPIVEGSQVATRYGMVKTDHILFIAAGAFHNARPSDLIPEMQGRFPIRVTLDDLTEDDFVRILTQPANALVKQYQALMSTEGVEIDFEDEAIRYIAKVAFTVNETCGNIGARRLHTVMEKLLEEISFDASELRGKKIVIDWITVESKLDGIMKDEEQSRTIL